MSQMFQLSPFRPVIYSEAEKLRNKQASAFWIPDEIPLGDDVAAWNNNKLTHQEKDFVTQILRMFTQSDVNVGNLYIKELIPNFWNNEIVKMFIMFTCIEGIHQDAYAKLLDTLGFPESEYVAFLEYKEMAEKHEFMLDMDTSTLKVLG